MQLCGGEGRNMCGSFGMLSLVASIFGLATNEDRDNVTQEGEKWAWVSGCILWGLLVMFMISQMIGQRSYTSNRSYGV